MADRIGPTQPPAPLRPLDPEQRDRARRPPREEDEAGQEHPDPGQGPRPPRRPRDDDADGHPHIDEYV